LTVYQQDEGSAPAQPAASVIATKPLVSSEGLASSEGDVATAESVPEPVLHKVDKPAAPAEDVADIVKKWSRNKK